jgi:hypothetical protein
VNGGQTEWHIDEEDEESIVEWSRERVFNFWPTDQTDKKWSTWKTRNDTTSQSKQKTNETCSSPFMTTAPASSQRMKHMSRNIFWLAKWQYEYCAWWKIKICQQNYTPWHWHVRKEADECVCQRLIAGRQASQCAILGSIG